jgi:AcrR family transcriptional regulator
MSFQVKFRPDAGPIEGHRARKKLQTRLLIEDAALSLFAEQGYETTTIEQISDRADVSTATFSRYFPSKSGVVLCRQGEQIPLLKRTIVERPAQESDLDAVRIGFHLVWVPAIDPERTMSAARAMASSSVLRGLYGDISRNWLVAVAEAIATRSGQQCIDERSRAVARIALATFGGAVENWVAETCCEDLCAVIDRHFAIVRDVCGSFSPISTANDEG